MSGLNISGKRVVITGAAGGLGRAFAAAFATEGARVLIGDIDVDGADETADNIRATGGEIHSVSLDVTDADSCDPLATAAGELLGGADVLINNAATLANLARKPFWELDDADWDSVLAVNVKGFWRMSRAMFPLLRSAGAGSIINLASVTAYSGSPHWAHYVASKGEVLALTRTMAKEAGPFGVRVNALAPGLVPTEALSGLIEGAETYGVEKLALGRQATEDDIVGGALFLASDLSGFVTGQTMIIDGGRQFI